MRQRVGVWIVIGAVGCGSGHSRAHVQAGPAPTGPAPHWLVQMEVSENKLCGLGVAGAGFDADSPYPKEMSMERAILNLAGILGTSVQEAIIDNQNERGQDVELARNIEVDEGFIEKVSNIADSEWFLDTEGVGPYSQKNFTYAHTCVDASKAAATFKVNPQTLASKVKTRPVSPDHVPKWTRDQGKQKDGRLCAVGFSLPMFFADKTFEAVVEDVRGQLTEVIQTLVSSYYEELSDAHQQAVQAMTVASTQALSRGVIVTDFWYDRDGIGPNEKSRTTYGFGCVYPMDVVQTTLAAAEKELPKDAADKIAEVKQHAKVAFDNLDAEIEKHP